MREIDTINFKTEIFEGPLELMLTLIAKHKLNIQDIEISILLEQFLNYIGQAQDADIELAGEFMETAARLIYIKTASLLPKHEAEQLKKELEGALIEYALCKATAERLRERFVGNDIFIREPVTYETETSPEYTLIHNIAELTEAAGFIISRDRIKNIPIPPVAESLNVTYVTVFTKIVYVLKRLRKGGKMELKKLFMGQERSEQVATFMALLELTSSGRLKLSKNLKYIEFIKGVQT
ncbi:MAG: segregation/condensation protein A [Oscillospiraceae bacterium]|nr:segregation/condensation protein A [Oscillospiraceae bacterium]